MAKKKQIELKQLSKKEEKFLKGLSKKRAGNILSSKFERDDIYTFVKSANEYFFSTNGVTAGYINKTHAGSTRDVLSSSLKHEKAFACDLNKIQSVVITSEPIVKYRGHSCVSTTGLFQSSINIEKYFKSFKKKPTKQEPHVVRIGTQYFDNAVIWEVLDAIRNFSDLKVVRLFRDKGTLFWNETYNDGEEDVRCGCALCAIIIDRGDMETSWRLINMQEAEMNWLTNEEN